MEGNCERVIETEEMTCVSSINSSRLPASINEWERDKGEVAIKLVFSSSRDDQGFSVLSRFLSAAQIWEY